MAVSSVPNPLISRTGLPCSDVNRRRRSSPECGAFRLMSEISRSNEPSRILAIAVSGSCAETNCLSGAASSSSRNVQVTGIVIDEEDAAHGGHDRLPASRLTGGR